MSDTFFWHDYETWGSNPFRDRACQFAGVRTDLDFNVIDQPLVQFCRPANDFLPSPEACLVTGITPQKANLEGVPEAEFIALIHAQMAEPGTCTVGYNNIRFDDEITRHTLYRNFFDPYAREWQQGNSRWDLIDVVRLAYALRPEGIEWPMVEDEQTKDNVVSFRLELLTKANGISHTAAHDAMSDVYATIAIAKLLKEKQPRLFDYAFQHRSKQSLRLLVDIDNCKPLFHVSSKYPAKLGCCAVVVPLAPHPVNPNGVIVVDLRVDPSDWINLSAEELKGRIFVATDVLQEQGIERVPLKVVHLNKCPVLVETNILKSIDPARLQKFQLNGDQLRQHLQIIRSTLNESGAGLADKIAEVFRPEERVAIDGEDSATSESGPGPGPESTPDPDLMLYSGGFFSRADRQKMDFLRQQSPDTLAEVALDFDDPRIPEMLFRYRARNYPDSLHEAELERWERYRYLCLTTHEAEHNFNTYFAALKKLAEEFADNKSKMAVLEDLHIYGESIIPFI